METNKGVEIFSPCTWTIDKYKKEDGKKNISVI
jgi:hypothetical protein